MDFYERVKDLVKSRNTTIEALCKEINLSKNTYQTMKSRGNYPDLPLLIKMSEALGVSLDYLAYGREINKDTAKDKARLEEAAALINQVRNNL